MQWHKFYFFPGCILFALHLCVAAETSAQRPALMGWGGVNTDELMPLAAKIGVTDIILPYRDTERFTRSIDLGRQHGIGIYGCLSDSNAWKKEFPDVPPPLQVMSPAEEETAKRINADTSINKSGYQTGGEPVNKDEVFAAPMICFHDPRVFEASKKQIDSILACPGVKGVAFDGIGYRNYRNCQCPVSRAQLADYQKAHPDLSAQEAEKRFSLESLVDYINRLAAYARSVKPDAETTIHLWPVYLPEPLYGNRLDVDTCGQTAAWFFEPYWSREKIAAYTREIVKDQNRYFPRPEGVAMIGYFNQPKRFGVKSSDRIALELQTILENGCPHVQVCQLDDVLKTPEIAAVFQRFFGSKQR